MDAIPERNRSLEAFRCVLQNPNLRRIQLAWAGSNLGTWGYGVAIAVYAYDHGGAAAVGLVALLRWVPAALAAPFMGVLGDRHPRRLVMVLSDLGRVVVIGLAALAIILEMNPLVVYILASAGVVISTAFRPAEAALLPNLVSTPEELTAANVASSSIESVGMFVGPAIGGLILAVSGPAAVFFVAAVTFLWSAALIFRVSPEYDKKVGGNQVESASLFRETREGFGAAFMNPNTSLLIGLSAAQMFVAGALVVLEVVIALELLGKGDAWVGILSAAFGVGGGLGVLAAGARIGGSNLAVDFAVGIVLWGLPLVAIGIWPDPVVAVAMMTIMGFGNTLVDVSGLTLLQRIVPDEVIARVFGVMETTVLLSVSLGAAMAPLLVEFAGADVSLVLTGIFLPVVMILAWRRFNVLGASTHAPERELAILAGISFFEPLPRPVLEHLARRLSSFRMPAGARVFEQGDRGDRFYVVAAGVVDILKDGKQVAHIGPGGYFGEIALLSDVPRQASARIHSDCELLTLEGEDFVAAVTGHARSKDAAHAVIQSYSTGIPLGGLRAGT